MKWSFCATSSEVYSHPHVRAQQRVVHAAFEREPVGELFPHGESEAQRLVVSERILAGPLCSCARLLLLPITDEASFVIEVCEHPGARLAVPAGQCRRRQKGERRLFYAGRLRTARRRTPHDRPRRPPTALRAARGSLLRSLSPEASAFAVSPEAAFFHRTTPSPPLRSAATFRAGPQAHRPSGDLSEPPSAQAALRPQRGATAAPGGCLPATCSRRQPPPPLRRPVRFPAPRAAVWHRGCPSSATDAITVPSFSNALSGRSRNSPATAPSRTTAAAAAIRGGRSAIRTRGGFVPKPPAPGPHRPVRVQTLPSPAGGGSSASRAFRMALIQSVHSSMFDDPPFSDIPSCILSISMRLQISPDPAGQHGPGAKQREEVFSLIPQHPGDVAVGIPRCSRG